jgi:tRNA-Thr(GGU) m(6)t(6)A37 methyltransferase TsaA
MTAISFTPIGVIHTPFADIRDMPIQPAAARGVQGRIELDPAFQDGLEDLDGFSHITLLYHFHRSHGYDLRVTPFMDTHTRGVFACKAPRRPNPIGLSTVRLTAIENAVLHIEEVDMLDGTPLLDIKPFFPRYDNRKEVAIGWLAKNRTMPLERLRSDARFDQHSDRQ